MSDGQAGKVGGGVKLIGLGHESGVGKDTLAEAIAGVSPNFLHVSFASELKYQAWNLFHAYGVRPPSQYDQSRARRWEVLPALDMDVVDLWIALGNAMRSIHPNYWIDRLEELLISHSAFVSLFVISDVRFVNEARAIKAWGGEVWKVERSERVCDTSRRASDHGFSLDFQWDRVIPNEGSRQELVYVGQDIGKDIAKGIAQDKEGKA